MAEEEADEHNSEESFSEFDSAFINEAIHGMSDNYDVDIEDTRAKQEKSKWVRDEKKKKAIHVMFLVGLWIIFIVAMAIMVIRAVHMILPDVCKWLNPDDLAALDKSLYSLLLGSILGKYTDHLLAFTSTRKNKGPE